MANKKVLDVVIAARRRAHEEYVQEMREGRRLRAITVPSGKSYKRKSRTDRRSEP